MSKAGINLHFRIHYHTHYGQNVMICGNIKELGEWKTPKPLNYSNESGEWDLAVNIPCPTENTTIKYKYVIESQGHCQWEPEKDHELNLAPVKEQLYLEIFDVFRWHDHVLDAYTRSAFVDVINRRQSEHKVNYLAAPSSQFEVFFSCVCPNVKHNQKLVVVGSCDELGNWDPKKALELKDNDFPRWSVSKQFEKAHVPFEFKYAIVEENGNVIWDTCNNLHSHQLCNADLPGKTVLCLNHYFINPDSSLYHGFGIYVPLFSLRSATSCGIGQYSDIKPLVDVCNKLGASLIQILPINDTTYIGKWDEFYPYRQVSCFALNPSYIDLLAITPNLPAKMKDEIKAFAAEQEKLKTVDYPAIFKFKTAKFKEIYELVKSSLASDKKFQQFKKENAEWLNTYSLFCHFRAKYNTSNFREWPEYSSITDADVATLSAKFEKELDYTNWIQYVCDQQFHDAVQYAIQHRVVLKGDLPIGVSINSVECWAMPKNFRMNMSAGAPPDPFSDQGQNWGFPTYDWDFMEKDNNRFWSLRLSRMGHLFQALRVDHILGFFRIWEIPRDTCVSGMLGHFFPCDGASRQELQSKGLWDIDRYTKPYVRWHLLHAKFREEAEWAAKTFFNSRNVEPNDDWYDFKEEYNNEVKIDAGLEKLFHDKPDKLHHYRKCLFQLIDNVLLVTDPSTPDVYYPRTEITMEHIEVTPHGNKIFTSTSWAELPEPQKSIIKEFYFDFTFERQNEMWTRRAKPKLNILKTCTNMLICAEDLGQLTDGINNTIKEEALLSLRVQRMSKDLKKDFDEYQNFSYLSVCCPSTHDCSSLRGWWEENSEVIEKFWRDQLWRQDTPAKTCEPWIQETIFKQHLFSNSMFAVFLLQDVTGITEHLRRQTPQEEQINIPADPNHKWCYRFPYTLEELLKDEAFTKKVYDLCKSSNRI